MLITRGGLHYWGGYCLVSTLLSVPSVTADSPLQVTGCWRRQCWCYVSGVAGAPVWLHPSLTPMITGDRARWSGAVSPATSSTRGQSHTSWPRTINRALINFAEVNWRVLWRWSCSDLSLTLLINSPESRQPGVTCWLEFRVLWPQLGDCHVTGAKRLLLLITPVQQQRH